MIHVAQLGHRFWWCCCFC